MLLVYNEQEPESKPLADYYAQQRSIPEENIESISIRPAETITRREFEEKIRAPLRVVWEAKPNLEYVVLVYGVPLRVENDPAWPATGGTNALPQHARRNDAAVDSELALLPVPGAPVWGVVPNPRFRKATPPKNQPVLLVARLDGPDPATVRRMIDDTIATEQTKLEGRVYLDEQAATEAGYRTGDEWLRAAGKAFRAAGFECASDTNKAVYAEDAPLSDVAVYAGWYAANATGPFKREDFQFRRGAVAVHIHSASGASLRSRHAYWVGPLLARGAAATLGNVFEPYLQLTPHLNVFFERLLAGATFGEAAYASQPALSWQTIVVGDPLYRPFGQSLETARKRAEAEQSPDREWLWLRKINLLAERGQRALAEEQCRKQAEALRSPVLYEKLGDLARADGRAKTAQAAYAQAQRGYEQRADATAARRVQENIEALTP